MEKFNFKRNRFLLAAVCCMLTFLSSCTALLSDIDNAQSYTYKVTYMYSENVVWTSDSVVYPAKTVGSLPENPTKTDCTFKGWFTSINNEKQFSESTAVVCDITVFAQWSEASSVITNGTEEGSSVPFVSTTDSTTLNTADILGIVATTVSSSASTVATAAIADGKIAITSVAKGSATVTCEDGSSHRATIAVTVSETGAITLGIITKYTTSNANYSVQYYQMDTSGSYSTTAYETSNETGVVGANATYTSKTYVGFTLDSTKTDSAPTITADGKTVYKIYYARNTITITLDANGGSNSDGNTISGLYGASVTTPSSPIYTGYTFTSWNPAIPSTFPSANITCQAVWSKNETGTTFKSSTDSTTANTTEVLGIVATTVTSSATTIATVKIASEKIAITSVAKGSSIITCTDSSSNSAEIHITVSETGSITIDTITKYGDSIYTAPVDTTKTTPPADIHGYKIGVAWASWCPSHFDSTDFTNFMSKVDTYKINRVAVIPTYYLNNYTQGIISTDFDKYTPSLAQQEKVVLTLINKGVTINFRPHIDPAQFNSDLSGSVVSGTPGAEGWRGLFAQLNPMSDDYKQVISNSIEVLRVVLNSSERTMNLREKIRFDLGAELMDSMKNYSDKWVELIDWTRTELDKDENKIVKDNVILSYNFCHHIYYKMSVTNHQEWFTRILGPTDTYDDNTDLLYVDKMDSSQRQYLATFIKNLDAFTTSQYMPLDVTTTATADTSKDKCGFPDIDDISETDVKNALVQHEQSLFKDVFGASLSSGGLGMTSDELKAVKAKFHFGEYGMGIKGLHAPNVWDTTAYDVSTCTNCLSYDRQRKHAAKAIAGLINYIESDDALAQSLTIWMSGAPYDILDLFPSMSTGDSGHGYPGKASYNETAAGYLSDYWSAGTVPSSPATGNDDDKKTVTTKVLEGFESGTGSWTLPSWDDEVGSSAETTTDWKTEESKSIKITCGAASGGVKKVTYYNEALSTTDYSDYKNLTFDVKNNLASSVKVCIAVCSNSWTWYESEQQSLNASSENTDVSFDLTSAKYRTTDTGAYENSISGLGAVQRFVIRFYLTDGTAAGTLNIDDIELVPETAD